ncbi:MAG: hypothetical protein FJZ01_03295 [Candidatus Sericytochromatia bacterium]|nr:hypothetical protein [Candidatus Tanganyikabacteria bacterium]
MSGKHIPFIPAIMVAGALFVSLSAGCGTRVGPDGDPNVTPPPAAKPTPTPAATASVAPTPAPTPVVPTPTPELQVSQQAFKKGVLFGWWDKPAVDVMVTNPTALTLSGTVKVSFTKGGTPTGDDQTREVTLGTNQTQTLHFEAKKSNPDAATLGVTTNPPVAAPAPAPGAAAAPGTNLSYGR